MFPGTFFTPPTRLNIGGPTWPNDPLIFLAGPIQGAPDWQAEARDLIRAIDGDIHIASPRRLGGFVDLTDEERVVQYDWERRYLAYAAKYGVTLFWCANEETHHCGRPFAQTTRYELGKQAMRFVLLGGRMVAGFDTAFSGQRYLKHDMTEEARAIGAAPPEFCDSLAMTCHKAVDLIHSMYRARATGAVEGDKA